MTPEGLGSQSTTPEGLGSQSIIVHHCSTLQDLLSALLDSVDDQGLGMSDRGLRDELMTLLVAGQETSAILLGWAAALLAYHPRLQARVATEVAQLQGLPTLEQLRYGMRTTRRTLIRVERNQNATLVASRKKACCWVTCMRERQWLTLKNKVTLTMLIGPTGSFLSCSVWCWRQCGSYRPPTWLDGVLQRTPR